MAGGFGKMLQKALTVQQLIDELQKIENKELPVMVDWFPCKQVDDYGDYVEVG